MLSQLLFQGPLSDKEVLFYLKPGFYSFPRLIASNTFSVGMLYLGLKFSFPDFRLCQGEADCAFI